MNGRPVIELQVLKPIYEGGLAPAKPGDAGHDLRAAIDAELELRTGCTAMIPTGIAVHIANAGIAGMVLPRSGLASKHGLAPANSPGLIDSSYTGEIVVALANRGGLPYKVQPGQRIAQLVFTPVLLPVFYEVQAFSKASERGAGGFGSTGKQ